MFDNLLSRANGDPQLCPHCNAVMDLQLSFDLGLNAPNPPCVLRDCFVPRKLESWSEKDGSPVTFYPFLVILRRYERGLAAWLPYWHIVERKNRKIKKYGQWAPFMDFKLFSDLLAQAAIKGYVLGNKSGMRRRTRLQILHNLMVAF